MRRGHKRLLVFELILFIIFFINSFVSNILGDYEFIFLLILSIITFKIFYGLEKDKNRFTKDVIFDVIIFLLIFFLLFYILGLFISFARVQGYYNWYGLKTFIIPSILTIILKEVLRYSMVKKALGSKFMIIITCILFIFLDLTNTIYFADFKDSYGTFMFTAMHLLPSISINIAATYITMKTGYKPIILYLLTMKLYQYLIPIIPNPDEYLTSVIHLVLPVLLGYKVRKFFKDEEDEDISSNYNKGSIIGVLIPLACIIVIVYFTSGYFHYYAVAIASGSMEPNIHKGDIAIIEKIEGKYEDLKVGHVLAYKHSGVIVVHRITKILKKNDVYYFYTQGDANTHEDNYVIYEEDVIGIVEHSLPYAGMGTVWLNEL